jgi:cyclohexanone monooxygenase
VGYIQGGLNATTTEQFSRQGYHIAHVISETMKRGAKTVEPSQEAQDAYVKHFEEVMFDSSQFQRECTPSYFTNEGQVKAPWALFRSYGPGWTAFQKLLADWRDKGDLEGLVLG